MEGVPPESNNGTDANGQNTIAPPAVQYLGPLIIAQKGRPVRVKFTNKLPLTGTADSFGQDGNLFIPGGYARRQPSGSAINLGLKPAPEPALAEIAPSTRRVVTRINTIQPVE